VPAAQTPQPATPAPRAAAPIDVDAIPVSVVRIRKQLAELPPADVDSRLRLNYYIEVFGQAPRIDFLAGVNLNPLGAVQYGGMTHREFLDVVTPMAYRAPVADLSSLAYSAMTWAIKRSEDKRRAEEKKRIEEEARRLRDLQVR